MPEYQVQLRGWHALAGVVFLLGYFGASMYVHVRSVDDGMRDAIRQYLQNEYSGRGPKDVVRILGESRKGMPIESVPDVQQRDVEFPSIAAHGRWGNSLRIVRAEINVDGASPPEGAAVRYFTLDRGLTSGWMVIGQAASYRYFSELFP